MNGALHRILKGTIGLRNIIGLGSTRTFRKFMSRFRNISLHSSKGNAWWGAATSASLDSSLSS